MQVVKILHCADHHIGAAESFLGTLSGRRRFETLMTFERIIDLASEEQVGLIAIAGDLFDSNTVEDELVKPVLEKIASVPNIKVVFAAGNHDPLTAESPFRRFSLPENLFVLETQDCCLTFEDLKLKVYGRSFDNTYMKGEESFSLIPKQDGYIHVMVQHGELCHDLHSDYNAITPKFVRGCGMDYLALGHIHKRTPVVTLGNTNFAYCGCPEGQGFDEEGEKGVYIGTVGKEVCDLRFVPVSKRRHLTAEVDVTGCSSSGEISEAVLACLRQGGADFAEHLYKIKLIGELPEEVIPDLNEITARVAEAVYFVKLKDETIPLVDTDRLSEEVSLKGLFVKTMMEQMQQAAPEEKPLFSAALKLGLAAFGTEVAYHDD